MIQIILEAEFNFCYKKIFILFLPHNLGWFKKKVLIFYNQIRFQITNHNFYSFFFQVPFPTAKIKQINSHTWNVFFSCSSTATRVTDIKKRNLCEWCENITEECNLSFKQLMHTIFHEGLQLLDSLLISTTHFLVELSALQNQNSEANPKLLQGKSCNSRSF